MLLYVLKDFVSFLPRSGPGSNPDGWRVPPGLVSRFARPGSRVAVRWAGRGRSQGRGQDGASGCFHRAVVREDFGEGMVVVRRMDHGDEEVVGTGEVRTQPMSLT